MDSQSITPRDARFCRIKHNARMRSSYRTTVADPVDVIWASLADVDRVLAALPGTTLARAGDAVSGTVKCSVATTQVTYRLSALAEVRDDEPHTAVVAVTGKEARGAGTLAATLTVALRADGAGTMVDVSGDIRATGRAEGADDATWSRVLGRLVDAALALTAATSNAATPTRAPSSTAAPTPTEASASADARPALSVAPPAEPTPEDVGWFGLHRRASAGLAVAGVLLFLHRRHRRRRRAGRHDEE
jgi:uncharacterized protein